MNYFVLNRFRGDMLLYACLQVFMHIFNMPITLRIIRAIKYIFHSKIGGNLQEQHIFKFSTII